jgi:hypothetical protein
MCAEVVHDDDVAGYEAGDQMLSDELEEDLLRGAALDSHRGSHTIEGDRTDDAENLAAIPQRDVVRTLAHRRPRGRTHHRDVNARFVTENELVRGYRRDDVAERFGARRK